MSFIAKLLLEHNDKLLELEKTLGYTFKDKTLLLRAVTPPGLGYKDETGARFDYEALEFLGDRVINLLAIERNLKLSDSPGFLSKFSENAVHNVYLTEIACCLDIDQHVLMLSGQGTSAKMLANVMESISAAVYLDSKRNINLLGIMWQRFDKMLDVSNFVKNMPLSKLLNLFDEPQPEIFIMPESKKKYVGSLKVESITLIFHATGHTHGVVKQKLETQLANFLKKTWLDAQYKDINQLQEQAAE